MSLKDQKIGFIGLGAMGLGMATQCLKHEFKLTVNDIRSKPMKQLTKIGAHPANSVKEVAKQCSTIITVLPTEKEVYEVVLGSNGVFENARSGTLLMELSTINPATTDTIHAEAKKFGHRVLDAPIGRLAWHAERGESLFMVGGRRADYNLAMPLFKAMGSTVHYCGKGGSGIRTKLVNNYLAIILCQLNAEALALSQKFKLNLDTTLEVVHGTTATNGQLKINWPNKVLRNDTDPGFTIDLAHKDLSLILGAAHQESIPLPVAAAAREAFSSARARGYGSQDFSAMVDSLCDLVKLERARIKKS